MGGNETSRRAMVRKAMRGGKDGGHKWGGGGVTLLQLREQTSCCDEGVKRETGSKNCASPEVCGELEI